MNFITATSEEYIKSQADIIKVVGHYVELKRKGSNYTGLCPFHSEKSPSFNVSESKDIYKCFGCGAAGDAIKFVREHEQLDYKEALEKIAGIQGLTVEYEEQKDPKYAEKKLAREQQMAMLDWSAGKMEKELTTMDRQHWSWQLLKSKGFTDETLIKFRIGFTPGNGFLKSVFTERGKCNEASRLWLLTKSGTTEAPNYRDKLFDRISFPLIDARGRVVGIAGRRSNEAEGAKYKNPADTPTNAEKNFIYEKKRFLYGIHEARKHIKKTGIAYLVEGYTDVMAMHQGGVMNTVSSSGTSFTNEQIFELKKLCHTVVICFDMDDKDGKNPGLEAALKLIPRLIEQRLSVKICLLPEGMDPNDFAMEVERYFTWSDSAQFFNREGKFLNRKYFKSAKEIGLNYFLSSLTKNGMFFLIDSKVEDAEDIPYPVLREIAELISLLPEGSERTYAIEKLCKKYKIKLTFFKSVIQEVEEEKAILAATKEEEEENSLATLYKLPKNVDKEEFLDWGFYSQVVEHSDLTGYWFQKGDNGRCERICNFVLQPLFHKYEKGNNNRRVVRINNGFEDVIVELQSEAMISPEKLRKTIFDEGAFSFWGAPYQLSKIVRYIMHNFPKAYELTTLGMQPEGFFAYNSHIYYKGELKEFDEIGLVDVDDKKYFSPSVSDIYKDIRKGSDDPFETDRYLEYCESPITFKEWIDLMHVVYGEHALAAIPYLLVSLFRSTVYKMDNSCPHFYLYGPSESGKSKIGESLLAFCFKDRKAFALNAGTEFAFFNALRRFRDLPSMFNEFDDDSVSESRFQFIKGAYDGEGRERGSMKGDSRSEIMSVTCSLILVGQYLSTKDDNSNVNRSIVRAVRKENRTDKQREPFILLKKYEKQGINSLMLQVLQHSEKVQEQYSEIFIETMKEVAGELKKIGAPYSDRVMRNYVALGTMVRLFENVLPIGIRWNSNEDSVEADGKTCYKNWLVQEILNLSSLMIESDLLNDFWNTLEGLLDNDILKLDLHFKFSIEQSIKVTNPNSFGPATIEKTFKEPTRIMFIRVRECQRLYKQSKKNGEKVLTATNVETYMKNRPYYIGTVSSKDFRGAGKVLKTSCFALEYDKINTTLYRTIDPTFQESVLEEEKGEDIAELKELVAVNGKPHKKDKNDSDTPF